MSFADFIKKNPKFLTCNLNQSQEPLRCFFGVNVHLS